MTTSAQNFSILQKPKRENIRKVRAESLKPPQEVIDETGGEDHKFSLIYVANGQEIQTPCTKEVWKKVKGPNPVPGRKVPGLDHKIHHNFDIVLSGTGRDERVVDVDLIPKNKYERGLIPEGMEDVFDLVLKVNQSNGSVEVMQIPPKVRDNRVSAVLNALDRLDQVEVGMEIAGCEVTAVSGNVLTLDAAGPQ